MARRMSAAAPGAGGHRDTADRCLDQTAKELDVMPTGPVSTDLMAAHSAKAQVFATAAVAHALLEIADVLRAAFREPSDG